MRRQAYPNLSGERGEKHDDNTAPEQPPPLQRAKVCAQREIGVQESETDDTANDGALVRLDIRLILPGAASNVDSHAKENIRPYRSFMRSFHPTRWLVLGPRPKYAEQL